MDLQLLLDGQKSDVARGGGFFFYLTGVSAVGIPESVGPGHGGQRWRKGVARGGRRNGRQQR